MDFAGGFDFSLPNGTVRSANLTPHETGIINYNKQAFIYRFKTFGDSSYIDRQVAPDDFHTVMPWKMYATMTEEDLGAIYEYLRSLPPIENKVVKFSNKRTI